MLRLYRLRDYNFRLIVFLVLLSILGILLVSSADAALQNRQIAGVIAGVFIMIALSLFDYSWVMHFYWWAYALNAAMLTLVLLFGIDSHGAARWIDLFGFQFQPTELSKILLIVFFSMYFMKHRDDLNSFRTMGKIFLLALFPVFLIYRQPDLKNTITITLVFACLYFAAGLQYRRIGLILLFVVPLLFGLLFLITQTDLDIISDYQKQRIMTFLEPDNDEYSEEAMQQDNSVMAIGSGQLHGKGLRANGEQSVSKGDFIAEIQNDFIFAVAGEELGFLGCTAIIVLLFLIILECMRTGARAKDMAGRLVCVGMGSLIAIQSFINISVACGLLPNTGTTLPFVSYGLTSLLSNFIGMGLVLNVGLQPKTQIGGELPYERYAVTPEIR